jgi:hypothetical protein
MVLRVGQTGDEGVGGSGGGQRSRREAVPKHGVVRRVVDVSIGQEHVVPAGDAPSLDPVGSGVSVGIAQDCHTTHLDGSIAARTPVPEADEQIAVLGHLEMACSGKAVRDQDGAEAIG